MANESKHSLDNLKGRQRSSSPLGSPRALQQSPSLIATPSLASPRSGFRPTKARRMYSASRSTAIDLEVLKANESKVMSDPIGMYLIYESGNNGSWFIRWNREYLSDAWAFSKPHVSKWASNNFRVPRFYMVLEVFAKKLNVMECCLPGLCGSCSEYLNRVTWGSNYMVTGTIFYRFWPYCYLINIRTVRTIRMLLPSQDITSILPRNMRYLQEFTWDSLK